ncbi:MAG: hypothetical protein IJI44_08840 [Erysipelotrichaceae bacterium]|nr:hypothetical protein [Erysipelotrichaceae bacterium]
MIKKLGICFASILLIITCAACGANAPYCFSDYLNDLSVNSGIGENDNTEENFQKLEQWGVVDKEDWMLMNEQLKWRQVVKTINRLVDSEEIHDLLSKKNYRNKTDSSPVYKEEAIDLIKQAVVRMNTQYYEPSFHYDYLQDPKENTLEIQKGDLLHEDGNYYLIDSMDDGIYEKKEANLADIFRDFDLSGTYQIDFTQTEVIPYQSEEDQLYRNNNYQLLAEKGHVFHTDGFKVSYTVNRNGINVYVSKSVKGMNLFGEFSLNHVQPSFQWAYEEGDLKNCFFTVSMNTSERLGVSSDKYGDYYLKFKDLDSSSFYSLLNSMVHPMDDKADVSIPICRIRTPIPNLPTVCINLDLLIRLSANGRAELLISGKHNLGFETKNGQLRLIKDQDHDFNADIAASGKAAIGLNVSLEAADLRLADIEVDTGLKAEAKSTLHLFQEDGSFQNRSSNISYSALQEISKENPDVKICGDISLYWMMDLIFNTAKTRLYKLGFSRTFNILNEENQVFGNMHHIENGHFVPSCTVKERKPIKEMETIHSDKIELEDYARVLHIGQTYKIPIRAIPESYKISDLSYSSTDSTIAEVNVGTVTAKRAGNAQIKIQTSDGSYEAYINILVSDS